MRDLTPQGSGSLFDAPLMREADAAVASAKAAWVAALEDAATAHRVYQRLQLVHSNRRNALLHNPLPHPNAGLDL